MIQKHDKVVLRKVDLTLSNTPLVRQAQQEFGVRGIPDIRVYGKDGRRIDQIVGANISRIEAAVLKGLQ